MASGVPVQWRIIWTSSFGLPRFGKEAIPNRKFSELKYFTKVIIRANYTSKCFSLYNQITLIQNPAIFSTKNFLGEGRGTTLLPLPAPLYLEPTTMPTVHVKHFKRSQTGTQLEQSPQPEPSGGVQFLHTSHKRVININCHSLYYLLNLIG